MQTQFKPRTKPYDLRLSVGYNFIITKKDLNKTVRAIAGDRFTSPHAIYTRLYKAIKERPVYDGHGIDLEARVSKSKLYGTAKTKVEILEDLGLLDTAYDILLEIYQPKD
jgi:hypothetical protein